MAIDWLLDGIQRATRRALKEIDIAITRRRMGKTLCSLPPVSASVDEFVQFFSTLEAPDSASRGYINVHLHRMARTMTIVPPPSTTGRALELGCYMQMTPALSLKLGYHEVTGAYYGPRGVREIKTARMGGRDVFSCAVDLFDVEKDIFPYDDASFDLVLACEIIEHLERDPMHMLREINRVLDHRGTVVLTTPNCASISSIAQALFGYENPQVFACYRHPEHWEPKGTHVREYTPTELSNVIEAAGFTITTLFTEHNNTNEQTTWVYDLLRQHGFNTDLRGEQIYVVATKTGDSPENSRYPSFLYVR